MYLSPQVKSLIPLKWKYLWKGIHFNHLQVRSNERSGRQSWWIWDPSTLAILGRKGEMIIGKAGNREHSLSSLQFCLQSISIPNFTAF